MMVKLSPQEARTEANRLVTNTLLGVMVTMDEKGIPQPRWMGAASMDNLRRIYCLTAKNTRKLRQLKASPIVTWMFTSDKGDQVVTLFGMANIMESPMATQQVWDRLIEVGRAHV